MIGVDFVHPIVDCHCHIYPEKIAAKAVEGIGKFYDIPMVCDGTVADMQKREKEAGVTHCIVFSVATTVKQVQSINNFIATEVEKSKGFMTGLGTLHPDSTDVEGDIEHLMSLGLKGVKFHPDFQGFAIDEQRCFKIYEICEEKGLPVLFHTGDTRYNYSNPDHVKPILEVFPKLTVIGAHLGGWSMWDKAVDDLSGYNNFFVDCSSSLYAISPEKATEVIKAYGTDRVLFATDYPMWEPKKELERFNRLSLTKEEKEQILYKNAKQLFNLSI